MKEVFPVLHVVHRALLIVWDKRRPQRAGLGGGGITADLSTMATGGVTELEGLWITMITECRL